MLPPPDAKVSTADGDIPAKEPSRSQFLTEIARTKIDITKIDLTMEGEVEASVARCLRTPPDGA
jgi:hypothetical protein